MRLIFYCLFVVGGYLAPWLATAASGTALSTISVSALAQHPQWLRLLHYERRFDLPLEIGGYRSAIISSEFFVSADGQIDPLAELHATLKSFATPIAGSPDEHALCKFPARYQWLRSQGALAKLSIPTLQCSQFQAWAGAAPIESISLVYVTGYLGNPASYYGHVLLKLNSPAAERRPLLDSTLNYGAIIPDNENMVSYIAKGIFGGYSGGFTDNSYYYHNHNYGESELRDLWEYELNLTSQQTSLVVAHSWELLGKKYQYFFFDRNCAYRMSKLLEIATDTRLTSATPLLSFPQTITLQLAEMTANGGSLIKKLGLHPSRQRRLYSKFGDLSAIEKVVFLETARDVDRLNSANFKQLAEGDQQRVVETLLDYRQFTRLASREQTETDSRDYQQLLSKRFALPATTEWQSQPPSAFPHQGRKPSMLRIGAIYHQRKGDGLSIRLRPAYYDALDAGPAHVAHSGLAMGEIELESFNGGFSLKRAEVVKISSVGQAITGLPGDNGKVWRLRGGVERQNLSCSSCLAAYLEAI
ncbi:MAG: DUF4105 domain-containing protein [Immundisolibacteraceae bacterium]|nr:DUF4105 domain-containing protein [Immundisolibacteraceae bacterium]